MDIRSVVVDPDFFGPGVFGGGFGVKKQDIGLDSLGIKNAGGKPKYGVKVILLFLPNGGLVST